MLSSLGKHKYGSHIVFICAATKREVLLGCAGIIIKRFNMTPPKCMDIYDGRIYKYHCNQA